ncbi:sporulation protein [Mesobacillus campisalis]|uniref:Sporulation protein n=1 Tax=Mesobacillus campisalis TaxID=1408103 RepID=A0A0M2SQZ1_9BACI|nr:YhcN/YlaJ family sporulation lipoprotein [Mesobacillus campisalis]KKK36989.1 sporulation protein [Mesobacillus campisalis]
MRQFQILLALFALLVAGFTITGCNQGKTTRESRVSMIQSVNPEPAAVRRNSGKDHELAEKIKKEVQAVPAIYDVAVIKGKREVLVAYKVKHMQRFHMKRIEKEIKEKLEKKYPKETFIVSSDFKIFIEVLELKKRMKDKDYSEKDSEERLQKIIQFKKELT